MITYGFYDSLNYDRKYSAIQISSIFDGIVRDGIFMSIGECFRVIPGEDMMLLVQRGRAWFDHTWILNDAPLPIYIPQSEVILNRIDAVVIDVDQNQNKRKNDIIVVKGKPSSKPVRPTLIHDKHRDQYPLAYISVRAGVTSIRAADITSMVGTSETPYVTGILETVNIDNLLDQWKDQWQEFYENQTQDIENYNEFWKREWEKWYEAQTNEIQESYLAWEKEWELWSTNYKTMMNNTAEEWKQFWDAWFYTYINQNQIMINNWQKQWDDDIRNWFDNLKYILDGDAGVKLAEEIVKLKEQLDALEEFRTNLATEHTVYDKLYDNNWTKFDNVVDSDLTDIIDSASDPLIGRNYSSDPVLDSNGYPITAKLVFVIK